MVKLPWRLRSGHGLFARGAVLARVRVRFYLCDVPQKSSPFLQENRCAENPVSACATTRGGALPTERRSVRRHFFAVVFSARVSSASTMPRNVMAAGRSECEVM